MTEPDRGAAGVLGPVATAAWSVGWFEVLLHLLAERSLPTRELVLPVACTVLVFGLVQLVAVAGLAVPARRWAGWGGADLATRVALFSALVFALLALAGRTLIPISAVDLGYLAIAGGAAGLVTAACGRATSSERAGPWLAIAGVGAPGLLLGAVAYARFSESLGRVWEPATLGAFALAAALGLGLAFGVSRLPARVVLSLRLALLAAAFASGFGFGSLSASSSLGPRVDAAAPAIETVVVITIDTMRARDLSLYGGVPGTSPHIDALGDEAVVFDNAIAAAPLTLGGLGSIMTGVSPLVHRARKIGIGVPVELDTLAERLAEAGFHTAAIGQNTSMFPRWGLAQGFQSYEVYPRARFLSFGARQFARFRPLDWLERANATDITALGRRFLASEPPKPLFLWLHYVDPHNPYTAPSEYWELAPDAPRRKLADAFRGVRLGEFVPSETEQQQILELYRGEVRYTDEAIGEMLTALREAGLYDDALIILTGDHGEEFFEHGGFEHGHNVRDVVLHVPLIVKLPQGAHAGRVAQPVPTQSVMATVLDLVGQGPEAGAIQAPSLRGFFEPGGEAPRVEPIVSSGLMYFENRVGLRYADQKYVRYVDSGKEVVFDLAADPGESRPIPGNLWPGIEELRRAYDREVARAARIRTTSGIDE